MSGDAAAEGLIYELQTRGYEIEAVVEQEAIGRLATARLTLPEDPSAATVDLLFASSGIEDEIIADAELLEVLPGLRLPVARTGPLLALKVLA